MGEITLIQITTWTISTVTAALGLYRFVNSDYREGLFTRRKNSMKYIRYILESKDIDLNSIGEIREKELIFKHVFGVSINANYIGDYVLFYQMMGVDFTFHSMKSIFKYLRYNYEKREMQIIYTEKDYKFSTIFYWIGFLCFFISALCPFVYNIISKELQMIILGKIGLDQVTFYLSVITMFGIGTWLLLSNDNIRKASYFKKQYEELKE